MKIEHRIHIDAPVEVVWTATADITSWPDWTPTVTSVEPTTEGPAGLGSRYVLKQPMQARAIWEITEWTPGSRFAWEKPGRFLRFKATHVLEPAGEATSNLLILEATGPAALLLHPVLRTAGTRALQQENAGLKAFCEGRRV